MSEYLAGIHLLGGMEPIVFWIHPMVCVCVCVCVCESYIGKPIGTRAVPQFITGVAKPLTQIEPGKN